MKIIGIDPGTVSTGYGVVEEITRGQISYVDSGVISSPSKSILPKRLKTIFDQISLLLEKYQPGAVVVEDSFVSRNAQAALKLGQARGMVLLAAENYGLPIFEYTPTQIKSSVVGYGGAGKGQVQEMVLRLMDTSSGSIPDLKSDHASDALACAICHLHSMKVQNTIIRHSSA